MLEKDIFGEVLLKYNIHQSGQTKQNDFINEIKAMIIEGVTPPKYLFTEFGGCNDMCIIERYLVGKVKLPKYMKDIGDDFDIRYIVRKNVTMKNINNGDIENVYCCYGNIKED